MTTPDARLLGLLADLFAYPRADLDRRVSACAAALAAYPGAAARLVRFAAHARTVSVEALEEAYTAAFDLAPLASPYVGDQLFGASGERSLFLAALRELQDAAGVAPGPELPDHVSELLRLVGAAIPDEIRADLVLDGLAPVLEKIRAALEAAHHPWADVVAAAAEAAAPAAGVPPRRALEVLP